MKIAVFVKSTTFHKGFGGLETQNKVLCEGLVRKGHGITVFSPKKNLSFDNQILNGVSYVFVDSTYSLRGNWRDRSFASFFERHREKPFDLVISQSSAGVGVIKKKSEIGVKVISIAHGSILGEYKTTLQNIRNLKDFIKLIPNTLFVLRVYIGRQREFVLDSDAVVAVSKFVKKSIINETHIMKDKVNVIYNGIDPDLYKKNSRKSVGDRVKLIYVGQIIESKGIDLILKTLAGDGFAEVDFSVVGDGDYLEELKLLSAKLHLEKRVSFLGKLCAEEIVKVFQESDIFVLPSRRTEGFPMALIEAMFAGLPIVASRIGGIPEAVEDGKTGFLFESGDREGFESNLRKLVLDENLRTLFGENALLKAKNEFALDVMLNRYEKVFMDVLR